MEDILTINRSFLTLAVKLIRSGDQRALDRLGLGGIDPEIMATMRTMDLHQLEDAICFRGHLASFRVDHDALRLSVEMATRKRCEDDRYDRAIRAGIRQPVLEQLTGIGRREFRNRRARLGLADSSRGRIEMLPESLTYPALTIWERHRDLDPLDRLLAVHDELGVPLDQLWVTIRYMEG